jgi:hypothetical protein
MKANSRFDQVYAILRYETDAPESVPINVRITVKKIVLDPESAATEVKRLNELNQGKRSYYFSQVTRIEKGLLDLIPVQPETEEAAREG